MGFFKRILDSLRTTKHGPLDIVSEFWEADFRKPKKRRFPQAAEEYYRSFFEKDRLCLELFKKSVFAWIEDPLYRYRDVVLEGTVSFDETNGHSSAGFVFRHTGADTYYYFLISNTGFFRFDAVFNGNPVKLIGWTRIEEEIGSVCDVRIIANGTSFVFCVNDSTVAEIEDELIDAGGIAFAAQNYEEKETGRFYLKGFVLESRPYHIEAQYVRWKELLTVRPAQRAALAESFYNLGHYNPAAIQLKKAAKQAKLDTGHLILLGECLLRLELYDQVLEPAGEALRRDPGNMEAIILQADALYSLHRLLDARAFLHNTIEAAADSAVLWNLWGNVEYGLGNISEAAEKYEKAAELDPETAIFPIHAGRCCSRLGDCGKALAWYEDGARLLFRQEAFDDIVYVLRDIRGIDPENPAAQSIQGKIYFQNGNFPEADTLFASLIGRGEADAGVFYLSALLRVREGDRRRALELFNRALELEDDYYLYWFKRAETEYALGGDPEYALERSLACGPDDPWVFNFAGMLRMEQGDVAGALPFFRKAYAYDSGAEDIGINLSEALAAAGRPEEAAAILLQFPEGPCAVMNQLGNIYARQGKFEAAAAAYEKCIEGEPKNTAYIENAASVYIELDQISRAEELLRKGLSTAPSAGQYNLMGNVAVLLGEYSRAEQAYEAGLELGPENSGIRSNFAELLCTLGDFKRAKKIVESDAAFAGSSRGAVLLGKIREGLEARYTCSSCGREWIVPKDVPEQGRMLLRGELPDECPAGECPDCGRLYCVACAKRHLDEGRFICEHCGKRLKLLDNRIKYLVSRYM
jgi:tetratricopeptide (TPR) repeat protein/DNA-directed RNA polymerase subunit RPC12/RpoP